MSKKITDKRIQEALSATFGSIEDGEACMECPCLALGKRKPIDMIGSEEGINKIVAILGRVRHGVFS